MLFRRNEERPNAVAPNMVATINEAPWLGQKMGTCIFMWYEEKARADGGYECSYFFDKPDIVPEWLLQIYRKTDFNALALSEADLVKP